MYINILGFIIIPHLILVIGKCSTRNCNKFIYLMQFHFSINIFTNIFPTNNRLFSQKKKN